MSIRAGFACILLFATLVLATPLLLLSGAIQLGAQAPHLTYSWDALPPQSVVAPQAAWTLHAHVQAENPMQVMQAFGAVPKEGIVGQTWFSITGQTALLDAGVHLRDKSPANLQVGGRFDQLLIGTPVLSENY
ncbi:MAG: hypothetical protein IMW91_05275 [Firmicutes bacterium]|nr:hypothetical protein [Bacillota bacterium]